MIYGIQKFQYSPHLNHIFQSIWAQPSLCQDGLTGSAWGDWANYTDSPQRAFADTTGEWLEFGHEALWSLGDW